MSNHVQTPPLVRDQPGHSHMRMKTLQTCSLALLVVGQVVCVVNTQVSILDTPHIGPLG